MLMLLRYSHKQTKVGSSLARRFLAHSPESNLGVWRLESPSSSSNKGPHEQLGGSLTPLTFDKKRGLRWNSGIDGTDGPNRPVCWGGRAWNGGGVRRLPAIWIMWVQWKSGVERAVGGWVRDQM